MISFTTFFFFVPYLFNPILLIIAITSLSIMHEVIVDTCKKRSIKKNFNLHLSLINNHNGGKPAKTHRNSS
jgi:hypothetical protein